MPTPNIIENQVVTGYAGVSYYDFGPNQDLGPWWINSKRYVAYNRVLPQPNPNPNLTYPAIASSTDGINFTCHDQAHAPLQPVFVSSGAACLGNDGTTIYTCYVNASGDLAIIPFLTGTDLYGSILSGGPAVTSHVIISSIRMLSTGVLVVLYGVDEGDFGALQVVTCTTGGVWGTPQTVATDNPTHNIGMSFVPDSAGRAHILFFVDDLDFLSTKYLKYAMFDGAAVGGVTTITSSIFRTFFFPDQGTGRYDAANDRVLFPYQFNYQSTSDGSGLILVNNASTSPAIVQDIVLPENDNLSYFGVTISTDGSTYLFTYEDYTTTEQLVVYQRAANSPGTWTGPTIFWNWDTDPPEPDPSSPGDPSIEGNPPSGLVPLPGGAYGTLISFFGGGGVVRGGQFCNTLYYMESPGAPVQTLQLIKQVSGGTASPTDFVLSASGPTPISGAGGVGPSNVDAGTYTLTETSVVDYTLTSLICVGGTQVGNLLTLADGQTAVCTFTNTFSGIVPPPPPDTCIIYEPTTPSPSLVAYDEPLELKGS